MLNRANSMPDFNFNNDSILKSDTIIYDLAESALKSEVKYHADDSVLYDINNELIRLYGNAEVKYEEITLTSEYIEIDWSLHLIRALGIKDSSGKVIGSPVFKENSDVYEAKEIIYDYETKKGKIKQLFTKEGEGYIHGKDVFKSSNDELYVKDGKYTTCSNKDPHFYFNISRLKVVPDKIVAAGTTNLCIEDIPTPLLLPFGLFPLKKGRKSGILIPEYGESQTYGFYLRNGGYYFGINDHYDLTLRGDIYSKGSWRVNTNSNYVWRYKFRGNLSINYANNKIGDPSDPNFTISKDFLIRWQHKQDPKARPGSIFSSNINFGTKTYHYNNSINSNDFLQNNMQSSVSYSKTLFNKKANLSVNMRHSQNNGSNDVSFSMPDVSFNLSRIQPLKNINSGKSNSWFKKLGFNYTMNMKNDISIPDTVLYKNLMEMDWLSNTINPNTISENPGYYDDPINWDKYMNSGIKHSIPLTTSFSKLFMNFSPGIRYTQRIYFDQFVDNWDNVNEIILTDTNKGLFMIHEYSASMSMNTRLYGHYRINRKKLKALWHVVSPRFTMQFRPDFGDESWGYYGYYSKVNGSGGLDSIKYSKYRGIYGNSAAGKQAKLNFSLDNFLEAKFNIKEDSVINEKKVKLFETFNISSGYNWAVDTLNMDPVSLNFRTSLFKNKLNFVLRSIYDPYAIDSNNVRQNEWFYDSEGKILRFSNTSFSMNANFSAKKKNNNNSDAGTEEERSMIHYYPEMFIDFNIPWRFGFRYNLDLSKSFLSRTNGEKIDSLRLTQTLGANFDINITPKWKIAVTSGYDFTHNEIAYTTLDIYRDLHCWELKIQWVPLGSRKSYSIAINVKAPILQDLKLQKRKNWFDY